MEVDLHRLAEAAPKDPRLALGGPATFSLPLLLTFPEEGSILLETNGPGREQMLAALNNLILRLLSTAPPGRLSFTIIDPVGLGQSFADDLAEVLVIEGLFNVGDDVRSQFERRAHVAFSGKNDDGDVVCRVLLV